MAEKIKSRLWLKLRVGKPLATEEQVLKALVAGRTVTIESDRQAEPLSKASWLVMGCRGFETKDDARGFGEKLRRAVHLAGLCARVGVDAGDPGEDRAVSWVNPEMLRSGGGLGPDTRIGSDVHGIEILPDDGKTLFVRLGQPTLQVRSNAGDFVLAIEEALPEGDVSESDFPSIRRAIRVLNLAEMNTDPIAKVVLAISTIEGLATDPVWCNKAAEVGESAKQGRCEWPASPVASGNARRSALPHTHGRWLGEPPPGRRDRLSPGGESGPPGATWPTSTSPD